MRTLQKLLCAGLFLICVAGGQVFSQNRYALVIGNNNYTNREIATLTNSVNDATDIAAVLGELGYTVTLKSNIGLREMLDAVSEFSFNLRRSEGNEGFFWFAGHGLSVRGIHYMLPVDVDPVNDNIIARGSVSVDDLMEEIGNARNKTNLIVIDACRNNFMPGQTRTVGGRGLAILAADDYRVTGNKIVYSTMAGRTAYDGIPGSRNSPFAQAFLENIWKNESFDDVFLDIVNETMRLTGGDQLPYSMGTFSVKSYTINSLSAAAPPQTAATAQLPRVQASPSADPMVYPYASPPKGSTIFNLDGKNLMCLSAAPVVSSYTFAKKEGSGPGIGAYLSFSFYEKYGVYGDFFSVPNSFFVSAEFAESSQRFNTKSGINNVWQEFHSFIWSVGGQYKIRMGEQQRFITNLGLCFSAFTIYDASFYEYPENKKQDGGLYLGTYTSPFNPGIGLLGGFSFRFTPLVSMDLGISWKMGFMGKNVNYGNEVLIEKVFPSHIGGRLGVSFWFDR